MGSGWERLTPAQTPGAPLSRGLAAASWDRDSQRLLIFGGSDGQGYLGDLWVWGELTTEW
ncbi:MAG: hypothetical protein HY329_05130 [Chloroflexi bacterium]|nr:hypothetical protein [Chloroflexota bacterium]